MTILATVLAVGILGGLLLVVVLAWGAVVYNRLVRRRNQVRASWAQIDVQLTRRHDLIPNLVETVRAYAAHERATLESVVAARSGAIQAADGGGAASRGEAEHQLTQALGRMFALAEAYPQLRADRNFAALQEELATTEDKVAYARQFYNSAVQTLTNAIESVPSNLVAGMFGFHRPEYFQAAADERGLVQINL